MESVMDSPKNSHHSVLSLFTKKKIEKGNFLFLSKKIVLPIQNGNYQSCDFQLL